MRQNTATYRVSDSCFETNTDYIAQLGMRFGENLVINMIIAVLQWENFSSEKYIAESLVGLCVGCLVKYAAHSE